MFSTLFSLFGRSYRLARPYGRGRLATMLLMALINGIFQVIGVTSVFPFFALASDPRLFRNSGVGRKVLTWFPEVTDSRLLVISGLLAIALLFTSSIITLLNEIVRSRYANGMGHWLRCRLATDIATRPYAYFLQRNTGTLLQKVLNDVWGLVQNVFLPLTEVISKAVTLALLLATMLVMQPWIALFSALGFGGFYLLVFYFVRPKSHQIGQGLKVHNRGLFLAGQQLMTGIKPIIIHGKRDYFISKFKHHSGHIAPLHSRLPVYSQGPRYLIEPVAFGALVGIVVVMALQGRPFATILPQLAVMAFTGYRLLPTVQTLYSLLSSITTNAYTLGEVEVELHEFGRKPGAGTGTGAAAEEPAEKKAPARLPFAEAVRLEAVTFAYAEGARKVLHDITLEFPQGQTTGIIGTTGSGKSTLVDLILGLHTPLGGRILIDSTPLDAGNLEAWRSQVGYVPQDIFLLDDTIAANIAFGIPEEETDHERIRSAAEAAQILTFVEHDLKDKFATLVGERGTRLSGGQRQRIGLARALYHRPTVLVLDEATSALDPETEHAVLETIATLSRQMTIILITHRPSTLSYCDRVIKIDAGQATLSPAGERSPA